ncbi:MAG: hypothetical protein R3340_09965 [Bizionia paragorgiae]|jgi:hypothetical protein|uniref:Uncharacterized protein n=2 Tax=Bizionia paragorgiae TaxID=283786 RepID=A0A1H3VXH3_BIZPA|nr:hypothetical protein [Bizionia paragorgiae]MDX1272147.1 hypothetical protein [Bizionia paragorgiae]SDZ78748.1 hypothetical protein SAMN04487990_10259 [Bizionia paragorgiae]
MRFITKDALKLLVKKESLTYEYNIFVSQIRFNMKFIYSFFVLITLMSCNSKSETGTQVETQVSDRSSITKEDIAKLKYVDYSVDAKAKTTLDSWQAYSDISRAISQVKIADLSFFTSDEEIFMSTVKELGTTIPIKINSDPIQARVLALTTKMYKLEETINLKTSDKKEKLSSIKDVLQAFSYLTLQVNKKYEKEAQNIIKPVFDEIEME